ncbi:proteinase [Actinorhabdospora filicis]|uniref:Proteinase n=1 Tax=Actinorhabdospora filicis TaxID=1785913 RepID=A0A9W6W5A0_9ACTN|nr:alpha/beta hydrolase [Actinorhabdospora filicis]GLZ80152.1 proteinase [Actinorhabdospora filicis]
MFRGRTFRIAVTATAALLLAACTHQSATFSSPEGTTPAAQWGACQERYGVPNTTVECATIKVPADWDTPGGETLDLALVRTKSKSQKDRIGSLVINPGGPGGSGVDFAIYLAKSLPKEILSRFDIVGFDPRGVGRSTPVECIADGEKDAINGYTPDPVEKGAFDGLVALQKAAVDSCYQKYGDSLAHFASVQAARDMDAIRTAVGDDKLSYLGFSYGTLLGSIYAQQNGQNLRAAVLDGAVDPGESDVTSSEGQAAAFEKAFDAFAAWCKTNASTCGMGDDPRQYVMNLIASVEARPPSGANGRVATAGWVLTAVVAALYDEEAWPYLAAGLTQTAAGKPSLMFEMADNYVGRSGTGTYDNSTDAFSAVTCSDDATTETVDQVRAYQGEWRGKYPMFGAPLALSLLPCALWRAPRTPYPTGASSGGPEILVVGTTGDPATPYVNAGKLAAQLGNAEVLTWEGEGHTAYPKTACVTAAVNGYLLELTTPPAGTVCPPK